MSTTPSPLPPPSSLEGSSWLTSPPESSEDETVRLVLAWVVLVLSAIAELVGLVSSDDLGQSAFFALSLTTTALALGGLAKFHRSDWFDWQRTKPPTHEGAPIWQLVAIGALVGALGGLTEPVDDGFQVNIRVADLSSI